MPDKSDILNDPTAVLADLLARVEIVDRDQDPGLTCHRDLDNVRRLHRHILAGGRLPRQWIEEGTAVGALTKEVRSMLGCDDMPEMLAAVRAVTGED